MQSRSDGVYRIHRPRIDSIGHVEFLFVRQKIVIKRSEGIESRSDGVHRIHRTRIDSIGHVEFLFVRHLENCHQAVSVGRKSFRWSSSDPSDTNRFHRTCGVSVRKTLRKLSSSDQRGSTRTRIDSIGHVEFLFVRHLENCHQAIRGGRKSFRWSPSDPSDTYRFHRTCGVSVRKTLRKLSSSGQRGSKVVPMESIGSIGHE